MPARFRNYNMKLFKILLSTLAIFSSNILLADSQNDLVSSDEYYNNAKNFDKEKKYSLAKKCFEKIIENPNNKNVGQASFMLADYYFESRKGITKDIAKGKKYYNLALKAFLPKAEAGDVQSQYIVGTCLKNLGQRKEAYEWLLKSAENGNANAQAAVSLCLVTGQGVKHDEQAAVSWLKKAVANGSAEAKAYLASYYLSKRQKMEEGIKLAKESSTAGNAAGQYTLGMAYQKGRGVPKSLEKAVELFRLAADQGQKDAIVRLKWAEKLLNQKTNAICSNSQTNEIVTAEKNSFFFFLVNPWMFGNSSKIGQTSNISIEIKNVKSENNGITIYKLSQDQKYILTVETNNEVIKTMSFYDMNNNLIWKTDRTVNTDFKQSNIWAKKSKQYYETALKKLSFFALLGDKVQPGNISEINIEKQSDGVYKVHSKSTGMIRIIRTGKGNIQQVIDYQGKDRVYEANFYTQKDENELYRFYMFRNFTAFFYPNGMLKGLVMVNNKNKYTGIGYEWDTSGNIIKQRDFDKKPFSLSEIKIVK